MVGLELRDCANELETGMESRIRIIAILPSKWLHMAACLYASLFSSSVFAIPSLPIPYADHFMRYYQHPILTMAVGAAYNNDAGESQNIPAHDGVFSFYNYAAHDVKQTETMWGGSLGAEFLWQPAWSLQVGLGFYQATAFTAKGIVTQGVDVASQNQYSYHYSIQSRQLLLENKFLSNHYSPFHPYFLLALGAAFNHSKNFSVDITPAYTAFSNQFKDSTTTSFSYTLGLGVDIDISKNARIGIGYRFADLARAKTGSASIDNIATTNTLAQTHLYAHELLAQFSFVLS
jgi:opacity protein-like surface antigen